MDFTLMSFQLTVFAELTVEKAKTIAKSFGENFDKMPLPTASLPNAPWFRVVDKSQSMNIDISNNRVDYFYREYDDKKINQFIEFINKNSDLIDPISRIALNYSSFIQDINSEYKAKLNRFFKFNEVYGDAEELSFRINNRKKIDDLTFNIITNCYSSLVQNSQTLESIKCIIYHYDINNVSVDIIEKDKLQNYFTAISKELCVLKEKAERILE